MKVTVHKKDRSRHLPISTEFIKLESALKLAGLAMTGGEAKTRILEGEATVNGEVCTMRGKKLYPGDTFTFDGEEFTVTHHEA